MRRSLLAIPAFLLFAATAAVAVPDTSETTFVVRPGHPVRLAAVNQSSEGNSNSTTWVIVTLDGALAAVDVEPSMRAQTSTIVSRPGLHRATAHCGNHIATVASCSVDATPAG